MEAIISPNLITSLKDNHLLLDTNVFIDASTSLAFFTKLFEHLNQEGVTLVTSDLVEIEFLKGAPDIKSYKKKAEFIGRFVYDVLPTDSDVIKNIFDITKELKLDGQSASIVDISLAAMLKKYKSSLYLLTRNTNDFPIRVFELIGTINIPKSKGIFTYGVYGIK